MNIPILIADTSEPSRELLKKILANNYPLIISESPIHALKLLQSKTKPRLILISIEESVDDDGNNIFAEMRKQEPDITLIAIGERNEEKMALEAVRMGASGYMIKPLNPYDIISLAEKHSH